MLNASQDGTRLILREFGFHRGYPEPEKGIKGIPLAVTAFEFITRWIFVKCQGAKADYDSDGADWPKEAGDFGAAGPVNGQADQRGAHESRKTLSLAFDR